MLNMQREFHAICCKIFRSIMALSLKSSIAQFKPLNWFDLIFGAIFMSEYSPLGRQAAAGETEARPGAGGRVGQQLRCTLG